MRYLLTILMCSACFGANHFPTTTQTFDRDPQWEGLENHPTATKYPTVVQDFGFKDGAIGGQIWRTTTPAWYAAKIDASIDQPLKIEATIRIPQANGGTVYFGFFRADSVPLAGRTLNAIGFDIDGANKNARVFLRAKNGKNESTGTTLPPAQKVKAMQTIPADGSKHRIRMTVDANGDVHGQLDEFPAGEFKMTEDFRASLRSFDRFGLMNHLTPGSPMKIFFEDIKYNDVAVDLSKDPQWEAHGNHATFEDHELPKLQAYGFGETNLAGGKPGEIGGILWRAEKPSYYGDRVGPFSLDDSLEASGTILMTVGAPDSGAMLGFFDSESIRKGEKNNFLGVQIEGPTRVGHYFKPYVLTSAGNKSTVEDAPRLVPDQKPNKWKLAYADGRLTATLDDKSTTVELPAKLRSEGAKFDRFGIFPCQVSGGQVRIFIDDVTYTNQR